MMIDEIVLESWEELREKELKTECSFDLVCANSNYGSEVSCRLDYWNCPLYNFYLKEYVNYDEVNEIAEN